MRWVKSIVLAVLIFIFVISAGTVAVTLYQYHKGASAYAQVADRFLSEREPAPPQDEEQPLELAPIEVDFEALQQENPDITGWIYCEDTVINYPVLHGADNDMYLRHLYDGQYSINGSIFVEAENARNFTDYNTIIYGHGMMDGSMFGSLESWKEQDYYEAHPVFWLLTPQQDYRIDIMGAYTTSAYSDTYMIFEQDGPALDAYFENVLPQSEIAAKAAPEAGSRYVLLTTCAYTFTDARFVVHGKLVPVDSAGGIAIEKRDS